MLLLKFSILKLNQCHAAEIDTTMRKILIVVPTYNESGSIRPLVAAIRQAFKNASGYKPDLLFVDDNSPDGTSEVVRKLQRRDRSVYLLNGAREGLGRAYIRGLAYGIGLKPYFAIVMMDADLSHDPADIPRMLARLEEGADYVIGSRYIPGGRTAAKYPLHRRFQSIIANALARKFIDLGADVKDMTGGFKAIRGSALSRIPLQSIPVSGYAFQVSLLYEFAKRNLVIREVPITFWPRRQGSSKLRLSDVTEFLWLTYSLTTEAKLQRVLRFALVGATGAAVNILTLIALVQIGRINVMAAYPLALELSIINNFFLNHWFTFRSNDETSPAITPENAPWTVLAGKLIRYNLITLVGAAISWLTFLFMVHELRIGYVAADVLSIGVATTWNYWLSVRLVWPVTGTPPAELTHELQKA